VFHPARQYDVPVNPPQPGSQLREGHSHLKRDPRLFRQHDHRSATSNGLERGLINRADFRRLALKVRLQIVPPAEVRLIAVREKPLALRTFPKGPLRRSDLSTPLHLFLGKRSSDDLR
jgi:hypothetical protein